jgi:hypothetical protein
VVESIEGRLSDLERRLDALAQQLKETTGEIMPTAKMPDQMVPHRDRIPLSELKRDRWRIVAISICTSIRKGAPTPG